MMNYMHERLPGIFGETETCAVERVFKKLEKETEKFLYGRE